MLKKMLIVVIIFLFFSQGIYASENNFNVYGIGSVSSHDKEAFQFEDIVTFMKLAAAGLDQFIDLIQFIRKNLPREQAIDLVKLLISILDDISIHNDEICMPMDTLEKSFRELTNIIQEAIDTARSN